MELNMQPPTCPQMLLFSCTADSWLACPPPDEEVIQAVVNLADQHRQPLEFARVGKPPTHVKAPC